MYSRTFIKPVEISMENCCIISFGWFPGVWILCADVSEHSDINRRCKYWNRPRRWIRQCSETSAYKIKTSGNRPKEIIQHSGHGKSFKSRSVECFTFSEITIIPFNWSIVARAVTFPLWICTRWTWKFFWKSLVDYAMILSTDTRGGAVGWRTALQAGGSRVRFPIVSLERRPVR